MQSGDWDYWKNKIKNIFEASSILFGFSFILGFLIWNIYLYGLGFEESDIIQTRFVYSGFAFVVISSFFGFLLYLLYFLTAKIPFLSRLVNRFWRWAVEISKINLMLSFFFGLEFLIIIIIGYSSFVFPKFPTILGGGAPHSMSLLVSQEEMKWLDNFALGRGIGSEVQTTNLCVAYEDREYIIVLSSDRILKLKKEMLKGMGSLPNVNREISQLCKEQTSFFMKMRFGLQ